MLLNNFLFTNFLDDGEDILMVCHTHIWIYRKPLTRDFLLGIALPIIFYFIYPPLFVLWFGWLIVGVLRFVYSIADWFYDAWLITNLGIIDVEWNGFFNKQANRIEYHMIDGIGYQVQGFWQTVLNYGDVAIQSVSGATNFELPNAAAPREVEREVMRAQQKFVREKTMQEHAALKDLLANLVKSTMK